LTGQVEGAQPNALGKELMRSHVCIAVIVIGRNEGQRLGRCLESVQRAAGRYTAATGGRVDCIYVDSQSSDDSLRIAREWRIPVAIAPPAYPTCANARMTGLMLTQSEYVMFVDGDMEVAEEWLVAGAQFLERTPQAAGVCGLRDDMRETPTGVVRIANYFRTVSAVERVSLDVGGAFLLRRSALRAIGGMEADLAPEEDYVMFCRLAALGGALYRIRHPMIVHWDTKLASPWQAVRHLVWYPRATIPGVILRRAILHEGWALKYLWHFKRALILHGLWIALCVGVLGTLNQRPERQRPLWLVGVGLITLLYVLRIWLEKRDLVRTVGAIPLRTAYLLHLLIGCLTGRPRVAFGVQLTDTYQDEVRRRNDLINRPVASSAATVSFIVVAHDAAAALPCLLEDLLAQDYPAERIETVLVSSAASQDTAAVMEEFRAAHSERCVMVLRNPKIILAAGWNVALARATGDIIVRVDAHGRIGPAFISRTVAALQGGEDIVGGYLQTVLPAQTWQRVLAMAGMSRFGGSAAAYRNVQRARYVDTLAHAAYSRHVFGAVGGYDERLTRTEDNDMHYRMRKAGYRLYYSPEIQSRHVARSSFRAMVRQKFSNGVWIGLAMGVQPCCFAPRHFVPMVFTLAWR
jgi:glycosyltransferase involved in cell wall biosynthesis